MKKHISIIIFTAVAAVCNAQDKKVVKPGVLFFEVENQQIYQVKNCVPGSDVKFYSEKWGGSFLKSVTADKEGNALLESDGKTKPQMVINQKDKNANKIEGSGMVGFVEKKEFTISNIGVESMDGNYVIHWDGGAAEGCDYSFELQRSTDGHSFTTVSVFPVYTDGYSYFYNDKPQAKTTLYRLVITNTEGVVYTTRQLAISTKEDVVLYPTMVTDNLNIVLAYGGKDISPYRIYNQAGQVVMSGNIVFASGTVPVKHLPAGEYILNVNNGKSNVSKKFIKQ